MTKGTELISLKQQITLQVPFQPAMTATVTDVEGDLFWTNLPRDGRQVLVLLENQNVQVGISRNREFYTAETTVKALGKDKTRFYGLAIPDEFAETLKRGFIRAHYATNARFKSGDTIYQTAMVNFSAGGLMVYLVPELEKILQSGEKVAFYFEIEDLPFEVEVSLAWRKNYDNIPFAGFEFADITPQLQRALAVLAMEFSKNQ
jgi:c-di-GMP-binding flagellar brake protein YcgR